MQKSISNTVKRKRSHDNNVDARLKANESLHHLIAQFRIISLPVYISISIFFYYFYNFKELCVHSVTFECRRIINSMNYQIKATCYHENSFVSTNGTIK